MSFAEYSTLRRAVFVVALLNLAYFGVEFAVALAIGSVSLFADSVDFLEDASINLLIFVALTWSAAPRPSRHGAGRHSARSRFRHAVDGLGQVLAATAAGPIPLTLAGTGALAVNLTCAVILARYRGHAGSLTRAAFLSARNDAFANVAIIAAGFVTAATLSGWPDLVVGLAIAAINADAAREVYAAARQERRAAVEEAAP